jgi:phosphoribosylformylglycinamidine synthase
MTDCLNFGNPENPSVIGQLTDAISAIADMGASLEIPVVSGNVSLYNETNKQSIPPTPMIVITGRVSDYRNRISGITKTPGLTLSLLGSSEDLTLGGSFLEWISGESSLGTVPEPKPYLIKKIVKLMLGLSSRRLITCSRSIGKGGILRSLLMMTIGSMDTGVIIKIPNPIEPLSYFFSESPGRIIIAHSSTDQEEILQWSKEMGVPIQTLGTTAQKTFSVSYRDLDGQEKYISETPHNLKNLYMNAISQFMEDAP